MVVARSPSTCWSSTYLGRDLRISNTSTIRANVSLGNLSPARHRVTDTLDKKTFLIRLQRLRPRSHFYHGTKLFLVRPAS